MSIALCAWWGSGGWYQQRDGRDVLFFLAQVIQDSSDRLLVLDARDDSDRSTATATNLDVYTEDAFKALRSGQSLDVAGVAAHPQESVFEAAAPEVGFEFPVDMVGE